MTHVQKYRPRTLIFDLGGSYRTLTRLFDGSYVKVADAAMGSVDSEASTSSSLGRLFTINPFAQPLTDAHRQFLFAFVRALVEGSTYVMSAAEEKDLFEQIDSLYEVEPSQRRLATLSAMLGRTLRDRLQNWVTGGPYASVFDNAEDTLTLANFQTFDFEGMEKSPQVLEALLFYIFHRASSAILDEDLGTTFKVFVMDEAWRFLKHPAIRAYAAEALKTWRKKNGAMILATQSTVDLLKSEMLDIVAENCPTKIFLANPGMNRDLYRQVFQLSETEADLIAGLQAKRQFLIKRTGFAKVLNLEVDPESYWIFTSDPYDNEKRRVAFENGFERGLDLLTKE